ncbi:hypothetical protein PM025_07355 [Halorubrum ezzemoulense]|nr:hypothetical protein [Halorubrum ezzemoulense]MDB2263966.1 hypothetical protein [Halorubrum ezzemoulense]MDB2269571.1 hypothetical protein [Halorubrum ezzemoulense]
MGREVGEENGKQGEQHHSRPVDRVSEKRGTAVGRSARRERG